MKCKDISFPYHSSWDYEHFQKPPVKVVIVKVQLTDYTTIFHTMYGITLFKDALNSLPNHTATITAYYYSNMWKNVI